MTLYAKNQRKLNKEILQAKIDKAALSQDWSEVDRNKVISVQLYLDMLDEREIDLNEFKELIEEIVMMY